MLTLQLNGLKPHQIRVAYEGAWCAYDVSAHMSRVVTSLAGSLTCTVTLERFHQGAAACFDEALKEAHLLPDRAPIAVGLYEQYTLFNWFRIWWHDHRPQYTWIAAASYYPLGSIEAKKLKDVLGSAPRSVLIRAVPMRVLST